jgi:hypothetical protein
MDLPVIFFVIIKIRSNMNLKHFDINFRKIYDSYNVNNDILNKIPYEYNISKPINSNKQPNTIKESKTGSHKKIIAYNKIKERGKRFIKPYIRHCFPTYFNVLCFRNSDSKCGVLMCHKQVINFNGIYLCFNHYKQSIKHFEKFLENVSNK